ncbi:zinc-binding dehydrogenase [Algoriphagus halophilus]|uniref:alcohol dehydrogenase n=1 Tax=Algoriphagus halophilus TaxID=226505 RepID=A0A1N6DKA8_9BACT|nr:zinc-binding dehydrogenase [Algoriphagus halophilus]SIN71190.1 putative phosphonate catabolism associated alcohol dehydrogenase [Algoriphagus halophilus]
MCNQEALAMVFQEIEKPFHAQTVKFPELKQGEVLIQITYATICTSDLHTYYGRRKSHAPSVLGHEVIGKVVDIAQGGVRDYTGEQLQLNDLVTWSVYAHDHDGKMAQKGFPQKSEDLFKYGHEEIKGKDVLSGGFASHCHLRAGTDIFRIPENVSHKEATPLNCTHATIAGAIRLAGDLHHKNVLVIGAGMLGISACAMSKYAGAKQVFSMDIHTDRVENTFQFGSDHGLDAHFSKDEILHHMKTYGGIDVVIDTSGSAEAMEKGLSILNIGGISIWVGAVYTQRNLSFSAEYIVRNLLSIKGLHNYKPEDLAYAIQFLSETNKKYPFEFLVSKDFPLTQLDKAFESAKSEGNYRVGIKPM